MCFTLPLDFTFPDHYWKQSSHYYLNFSLCLLCLLAVMRGVWGSVSALCHRRVQRSPVASVTEWDCPFLIRFKYSPRIWPGDPSHHWKLFRALSSTSVPNKWSWWRLYLDVGDSLMQTAGCRKTKYFQGHLDRFVFPVAGEHLGRSQLGFILR